MNAVEFNLTETSVPAPKFANKVRERALQKGFILLTCGVCGNVIRFRAPLTISDERFSEGLDLLEAALNECAAEARKKHFRTHGSRLPLFGNRVCIRGSILHGQPSSGRCDIGPLSACLPMSAIEARSGRRRGGRYDARKQLSCRTA